MNKDGDSSEEETKIFM